jgi:hypothetical protein
MVHPFMQSPVDEVDADHAFVDGVDGVNDDDDTEDLVATVSDFFASVLTGN